MRGEQHDEAVLCTQNKTYDMKEAQSSNSLLLCPSLKYPQDEGSYRISTACHKIMICIKLFIANV